MNKYSLSQSPLYKLSSKRKLKEILFITEKQLREAKKEPQYYDFYKKTNNKSRLIQPPLGTTKIIHKRVFNLLSRIETPDFLFSGVKGRSYVSNAKKHIESSFFLSIDIKDFFPSTSRQKVFDLFFTTLQCAPDIADILSRLLTINNALAQGSCISQILSYFANHKMFEELSLLAKEKNLTFSLYVDDMTFSSPNNFDHVLITFETKKILKKHKYQIKRSKVRYSQVGDITGVIIKNSNILVKNKTHKKVFLSKQNGELKKAKQLRGQAKYIQPSFPKKPKPLSSPES